MDGARYVYRISSYISHRHSVCARVTAHSFVHLHTPQRRASNQPEVPSTEEPKKKKRRRKQNTVQLKHSQTQPHSIHLPINIDRFLLVHLGLQIKHVDIFIFSCIFCYFVCIFFSLLFALFCLSDAQLPKTNVVMNFPLYDKRFAFGLGFGAKL